MERAMRGFHINAQRPRRFAQAFLIMLSVQAIGVRQGQAQDAISSSDIDTNLPRTVVLQHQSNHLLGRSIDVYVDDSKPGNIRYYTLFYVFPNWVKADELYKNTCKDGGDSKSVE